MPGRSGNGLARPRPSVYIYPGRLLSISVMSTIYWRKKISYFEHIGVRWDRLFDHTIFVYQAFVVRFICDILDYLYQPGVLPDGFFQGLPDYKGYRSLLPVNFIIYLSTL